VGDPTEIANERVWEDQRARFDRMREECPVAHTEDGTMVLRHAEVVAAATDPGTFSSSVTARRAIPNSLDGAEHAAYREIVDRYLGPEQVAQQEEQCRQTAEEIVAHLPRGQMIRTVTGVGVPYAVRTMSAWLGWPEELEPDLVKWMRDNHAATRSGDRSRTAAVAQRFDALIRALLQPRRQGTARDVTGELMRESVNGRPLSDEEVVSILRNFTAGDLGSLAASVGVIVYDLAAKTAVQHHVRDLVAAGSAAQLEAALEEILRIDDPFVSNRRRTTAEVTVGGQVLPEGRRILLNWTAANRDPRVFGDPDRYDPVGNAESNLVFGIGPHVCPARGLTLMELRVLITELVRATTWIDLATDEPAVRETWPVGGWARVPVLLR